MMKDQLLPALMAKLIQGQGVKPSTIERAVNEVLDIKLGESIDENDRHIRLFVTDQSSRLTKGK